jgi:DNA-binding CsgD family transcriptional regulator
VTIRPACAGELFEILSRAHELSSRESTLARHVVNGLGTSEIADRLSIVPYTVKDHLKSIFRKTGVSSRGELASRLTGWI